MKVALISASPRPKDSNSEYLLSLLQNKLEPDCEIISVKAGKTVSLDELYNCDALVFGFPLYVDSLPSHLLTFLIELKDRFDQMPKKEIKVYAVVNCGFFEGIQNESALRILKNWCAQTWLTWGQGTATGAGEMVGAIKNIPLGHGPNKNLGKLIDRLSENIKLGRQDGDMIISPNFPRFAFLLCSDSFWTPMAKKNGLTRKDLYKN